MSQWFGGNGDINDPSKYYGVAFSGALYQNLGPVDVYYINTAPILSTDDLIFLESNQATVHGPTTPVPGGGGEGQLAGQITVPFLIRPYKPPAPGGAPTGTPIGVGGAYTVSGSGTFDSILVGGDITLTGTLTLTANNAGGSGGTGIALNDGGGTVTGAVTINTYAILGDFTLRGKGVFNGVTSVVGSSGYNLGQASVLFTEGLSTIAAGATATTAGVFVSVPTAFQTSGTQVVQVDIDGSLTDSDTTNGFQIGVGAGAYGKVVVGGHVNSATVTVSGAGPSNGQGAIAIQSTGTWINSGTVTIGNAGTLTDGGEFDSQVITINGTADVNHGTLKATANGLITVGQTGTLILSNLGAVSAPYLTVVAGGTLSADDATITNIGAGSPPIYPGLRLNGEVDLLDGTTVGETDNSGSITIGFSDKSGNNVGVVNATSSKVTTNATSVGFNSALGAGPSASGVLRITNGSWTDQGAGTTMTVGAAGAKGQLLLTGGATLTDQSAVIASAVLSSGTGIAGIVQLATEALWTLGGNLSVGGGGVGDLLIGGGASTVSVAGALTVDAPSGATSLLQINGGVLTVAGGDLTLGGTGSGALVMNGGTLLDQNDNFHIEAGLANILGGATLIAQGITLDDAANAIRNSLTIGQGSTVDATFSINQVGRSDLVQLSGGTLEGATNLNNDAVLKGFGLLDADAGSTSGGSIQLGGLSSGGTLIAAGGLLEVMGAVADAIDEGIVAVNAGSTLKVDGSFGASAVNLYGSGAVLVFNNSVTPDGTISGFAMGDTIDVGVAANSASFLSHSLILSENGSVVEVLSLAGNYATTMFHVGAAPSGLGVSAITITGNSPSATPGPKAPTPASPRVDIGDTQGLSLGPVTDATGATSLSVTISDSAGVLAAAVSGSASVASTANGTQLIVSGDLTDVNATLATVTYTATTPGDDTLTLDVLDDLGGTDDESATVIVPDAGLSAAAPASQTLVAGNPVAISGVALADTYSDPLQDFTVTLADGSGLLSVVAAGAAAVAGAGTGALTVSGDLDSVNRTLASLTYVGATGAGAAAADSIVVDVADAYGGAGSTTIDLAVTQPVIPTSTQWATDNDGDAAVASNWTSGTPTAALLADAPAGYYTISGFINAGKFTVEGDVAFTGSVSAAGATGDYQTFVVDDGGSATIDGGTLTTPSLVLGATSNDSGALMLTDGAQATLSGAGPEGQAEAAYLGFASNSEGTLEVSGAILTASTGLSLGYDGIASLDVNAGGTLTTGAAGGGYADVILGDQSDGAGAISVEDAGSRFDSAAPLYVGLAGVGALDISAGGTVVSGGAPGAASAFVGADASSDGIVALDGVGSTWDVTQNLALGYLGFAEASVADGATLEVGGALIDVGHGAAASGELDMYGVGTSLNAAGAQLQLGLDGSGVLSMDGDAVATVASLLIGANADASLPQVFVDGGSVLNVVGAFTDGAATSSLITLDGGTIATGGGFNVGNGTGDLVSASDGAAITGGLSLASAATMDIDQTTTLGGAITFAGGSLTYIDTADTGETDTLSNAIVVASPTNSGEGNGQSTIAANGDLTLDLTGGIAFAADSGLNLLVAGGIWQSTAITGFAATDTLDLSNAFFATLPDTATWSDNVLSLSAVQYGGGAVLETVDLIGDYAMTQFSVQSDGDNGVDVTITACYAEGTRIATARGAVPVEELRVGDLLPTLIDGSDAPVIWLGHRLTLCDRHPNPSDVMPVRVRRGAFASDQPSRDLVLSPDHSVFIDGVLIPIRYLINGRTVVQESVAEITYWHVELPRHAVVLAEELPCESYLDTGNRGAFANGGAPVQLHPNFAWRIWETQACAPLIRGGAELEAARSWLRERAAILGHKATRDPLLRVLVAGREVLPEVSGAWLRFILPPHSDHIRIASRRAVPAHMHDDSEDHRPLGVAVSRITLDGQEIALTDPRLGTGWHAREGEGTGWRWTTGDAAIDAADARVLDLDIALTERYWLEQQAAPAERAIA